MANFMKVKDGDTTMLINIDQVRAVIEGGATSCTGRLGRYAGHDWN